MKVSAVVFTSVFVIGTLSAIGLFYLANNKDARQSNFATMCNFLTSKHSPEMIQLRCELLKDVHGKVGEIGIGTGANFVCVANNSAITDWTGFEPNPFMHPYLRNTSAMYDLSFPINIVESFAEDLSAIPDGTFDSVISTHVLCSVANSTKVLSEVYRVLKPGGTFYFLEHVAAPRQSWMNSIQQTILPIWKIVGDGCDFKHTHEQLDEFRSFFRHLEYQHIEAPIPLVIVKPHIIGRATK